MEDFSYNFSCSPFQLTADPNFFYKSKTHKRALSYLFYGLEQGEGFIVITGDVGTGKTTLVSQLLKKVEPENIVTANLVNTQIMADDLLRLVSAEFGLLYKTINKAHLLRNLNMFFRSCMNEGKRVLLIVDEAQNLPRQALEELRMLSNLQWQGKPLLQSFLLGQKQFRTTLQSVGLEQLRQRVIATHHLSPLDPKETREYILYRLENAGWEDNPTIDDDVFIAIHDNAQGVPRKINLLCSRLLLYGEIEGLNHIDYSSLEVVLEDIHEEFWSKNATHEAGY